MTRQPKHDDPQAAILAAARELILENGPDQLSLREVARRSAYSPAALYEYFDGKNALITAVANESLAQLTAFLRCVPRNLAPEQQLVELGLAYVSFARLHPHAFQVVFMQLPARRQSVADPVPPESPFRIVLQAVTEGVERGVLRTDEGYGVEEIAYSLWVMAHGIAMLQQTHLRHFSGTAATVDRRVFEVFVQALARP